MAGGLLPKPGPYPVDFSTFDQGFRSATQSPSINLPVSQEITTGTLFDSPQEFTTGAEIAFPLETVNTTTEQTFVVTTQRAILRLVTIAAIQYQGAWNDPCTLRWRIERAGVDVLNIVRYLPSKGATDPSGIIGEAFPVNNFIVLPGDILYIRYARNVTNASTNVHCHLHGTLLPD